MCSPRKSEDDGEDRPAPRKVTRNLLKPMPAGQKLKYIARNYLTRIVKLQACCGHPGQPGC